MFEFLLDECSSERGGELVGGGLGRLPMQFQGCNGGGLVLEKTHSDGSRSRGNDCDSKSG